MTRGLSRRGRAGLVAIVIAAVPVGVPAAAEDTAAADIKITGGDAASAIVCGNTAEARDIASQRKIALQKAKCKAKATGGDATLQNVDIIVSSAAMARNRANPVLTALAGARPPGVAEDRCERHRSPNPPGTVQRNICWAVARGGKVVLDKVTLVQQRAGGQAVTRSVDHLAVPSSDGGAAAANCRNVVSEPLKQRDDCEAAGYGGSWSMRGVDAVVYNPDGSSSTRKGINVEVRGGNGTGALYCFNVVDGGGKVVQINVCNADVDGGRATLRNVRIITQS
jgi:hypothetical protein